MEIHRIPELFCTVYIFLLLGIILYSFPSFRVRRWPDSEDSLEKRNFSRVRLLNRDPFQLFLSEDRQSHTPLWPQRKRQYLRERVTLSFCQPQSLGVILPLIVSLSHGRRTKGGITELTVIVLCGQDHSASRLKGAHLTSKTQETRLKKLWILLSPSPQSSF